MTDYVATVPINFTFDDAPGEHGLDAWIAEGDSVGDRWSGQRWVFSTWGPPPTYEDGCRLYIVCEDRVRGYAPIVAIECGLIQRGQCDVDFIREGGAVAVTIPTRVTGFRGYRWRWWVREHEVPFPDWRTTDRRWKRKPMPLFNEGER